MGMDWPNEDITDKSSDMQISELASALSWFGGDKGNHWLVDHGYMTMPSPGHF